MALDRLGNTVTTGTVYVVAGTARVIDGDQIVLVGGNGGETVVRAKAGDIARVDDLSGGGGGGVTDGDKGDIVVSSGGTVWTIDATGTRDASTFLRGDSSWQHVEATRFPVKNTSGGSLAIGTPVYATGSVGASGATEVAAADASSSATMPAIGVLEQTLANNGEGFAVPLGMVRGFDTSAYVMNGVVYVAAGGGLTPTRPTSDTDLVQNIGRVVRVHASTGELLVMGPGRSNDVQNLIPTSRLPGAAGVAEIDFGAFPGGSDASVTITGQTRIASTSAVQAWLQPAATADHTADEHRVETITVTAGNITPGVGFKIYASNSSQLYEPLTMSSPSRFRTAAATVYGYQERSAGGRGTRISGVWSVGWRWL